MDGTNDSINMSFVDVRLTTLGIRDEATIPTLYWGISLGRGLGLLLYFLLAIRRNHKGIHLRLGIWLFLGIHLRLDTCWFLVHNNIRLFLFWRVVDNKL